MKRFALVVCVPCAFLAATGLARAEALKAAVFDIQPVDLPKTPQMQARLTAQTDLLRKTLAAKGITIVDLAPQAKKIQDNLPLSDCNGCDQDIAKALGADIEVTTAVQSNAAMAFSLSGSVKDVATNRVLREGVVDIRGDTDDTWNHGTKFLVKERLTEPPLPADAAALHKLVDSASKADP